MTLDESTDAQDIVTTSREVTVAYNRDFEEYLSDVVIDFEDSWYNKGFVMSGSMIGDC